MFSSLILFGVFSFTRISLAALEGSNSGLLSWWKMDETSGTTLHDSSGNGFDGLVLGYPDWQAVGPTGHALFFNGTNNIVRIPGYTSPSLTTGKKTISAWVNITDFMKHRGTLYGWGRDTLGDCADNYYGIVSSFGYFYTSYVDASNAPLWMIRVSNYTSMKLGKWMHFTIVYDVDDSNNVTLSFYINGVLDKTPYTNTTGIADYCGMTAIASQEDLGLESYISTFSGYMSDFRIYNRALSPSEITGLYNVYRPTYTDTAAPSVPTGLTATPASSWQMNLSWNPSTDDTGVAGYIIYKTDVYGNVSPMVTTRGTGTTYTDFRMTPSSTYVFTLNPSTTYSYRIAAYDAAYNVSAQSSVIQVTTPTNSGRTYTLTVSKIGTPTGQISSAPSGINCGSTCSYSFPEDSTVNIGPYGYSLPNKTPPTNPPFTGWSGSGCSGLGQCQIRMNSDKTVTAYYGSFYPSSGGDTTPPTAPSSVTVAMSNTLDWNLAASIAASVSEQIQAILLQLKSLLLELSSR